MNKQSIQSVDARRLARKMFPVDGLLEGLICSNCEQCKPNMVELKLGGVMCDECHRLYEEMEQG